MTTPFKMKGFSGFGNSPVKNDAKYNEDIKKAYYHEHLSGKRPGSKVSEYYRKKFGPGTEYEAAHKRIGRTGSELTEMFNAVTKDD